MEKIKIDYRIRDPRSRHVKKLSESIKPLELNSMTLNEGIARALMKGILSGTIKGGEQLVEAELQKHFGVSKSPVREALKDLEKKGLVEIKPRKGAYVKAITRRDIEENFRVRSALEGLAAKEAYQKITEEDLSKMKQALEKMQFAAEKNMHKKYFEYHHLFHDIYLTASDNRLLIDILETVRTQNLWYQLSHQYYTSDFDLETDASTHIDIVNHFKNNDVSEKDIETVMRNHIAKGLINFFAYLEKI